MTTKNDDYPLRDTDAAILLRAGLVRAQYEGLSLRELARRLNYKQSVVLSHMAMGRAPIPLDRATDIAGVVGIPEVDFLKACLNQRHPSVDWSILGVRPDDFVLELTTLAGRSLDSLSPDHRTIMREVIADPAPSRRWLNISELSAVELLRELRPHLASEGLSSEDRQALRLALSRRMRVE